jgi:voltage-gated potassium channel Kch
VRRWLPARHREEVPTAEPAPSSRVDALYFSVATLTTVGYGDFSPQTAAGKLFTVVYVLVGVGLLLAFLSRVAGQVVATHAHDRETRNGRHLRRHRRD